MILYYKYGLEEEVIYLKSQATSFGPGNGLEKLSSWNSNADKKDISVLSLRSDTSYESL